MWSMVVGADFIASSAQFLPLSLIMPPVPASLTFDFLAGCLGLMYRNGIKKITTINA